MVDPEIPKKNLWSSGHRQIFSPLKGKSTMAKKERREIFAEKNQQEGHVEGHQQKDMDVSKNRGTPKMDGLQWKTLLKLMIWGYRYFWKHPYTKSLPMVAFISFLVVVVVLEFFDGLWSLRNGRGKKRHDHLNTILSESCQG